MKTKFDINNNYSDKGANTENISMQEIHFTAGTNFNAGGKCVFRNAAIHINENIVVKGEYGDEFDMEFNNCIIYYHERAVDKPLMEFYRKTSLAFDHCTFIDCGAIKDTDYYDSGHEFLFYVHDEFSLSFDDCRFEKCSKLFSVGLVNLSKVDFTMQSSLLNNCGDAIIYAHSTVSGNHGVFLVADCIINGNGVESSEVDEDDDTLFSFLNIRKSLFSVFNNNVLDFYAYNNFCLNMSNHCYNVKTKGVNQVRNNTFLNSDYCIRRMSEIADSMFINCINPINECDNVNSCCFDNCADSISELRSGGSVRCSRFINSRGQVISAAKGDTVIFDNEFLGNSSEERNSMLYFTADDYDSKPSEIISCVFDSLSFDNEYLIDADLNQNRTESVIAEIRDCRFSNITTERSDEKIINDKLHYDFLLWKNQEVEAVRECSGNRGIDEVNVKNAQPVSRERMDTNRLGIIIGSDLYSG